ncbi:hypothetical protein [Halomarina rubra]|uniref:Lipoprotein n=1 Tax=Halomarina rubra TaxID=2071873 RepID=A0ABD6AWP3_9EURY|nr:hypothetical protein [Halomarina rubra]
MRPPSPFVLLVLLVVLAGCGGTTPTVDTPTPAVVPTDDRPATTTATATARPVSETTTTTSGAERDTAMPDIETTLSVDNTQNTSYEVRVYLLDRPLSAVDVVGTNGTVRRELAADRSVAAQLAAVVDGSTSLVTPPRPDEPRVFDLPPRSNTSTRLDGSDAGPRTAFAVVRTTGDDPRVVAVNAHRCDSSHVVTRVRFVFSPENRGWLATEGACLAV